jgi:hypothetical protein
MPGRWRLAALKHPGTAGVNPKLMRHMNRVAGKAVYKNSHLGQKTSNSTESFPSSPAGNNF